MLTAFCTLALALATPLASALTLETPTNWVTSSRQTIRWTNQEGDPTTWSFELVNEVFNNKFALANTVDPSSSSLEFILGSVPPGDGYTLEAVNIGNISDIYARSGTFSIGVNPNATSSSSATSTGSGSSASSGSPSTASATAISALTSATRTGSTGTGANSSPSSSSTDFNNNGAGPLRFSSGSYAVALLGVVAGAAVVAL